MTKATLNALIGIRDNLNIIIDELAQPVCSCPNGVSDTTDTPTTTAAGKKSSRKEKEANEKIPASDEITAESLNGMSYNNLKKLAKSLGVSATGARDEIIERILNAGSALSAEEPAPDEEDEETSEVEETEDDSETEDDDSDDEGTASKRRIRLNLVKLHTIIKDSLESMSTFTPAYNADAARRYYKIQSNLSTADDIIIRICNEQINDLTVDDLMKKYVTLCQIYDISTRSLKSFAKEYKEEAKLHGSQVKRDKTGERQKTW